MDSRLFKRTSSINFRSFAPREYPDDFSSSPLVFSLLPLCQGQYGSQKNNFTSVATVKSGVLGEF
jgi:hypothetical protein